MKAEAVRRFPMDVLQDTLGPVRFVTEVVADFEPGIEVDSQSLVGDQKPTDEERDFMDQYSTGMGIAKTTIEVRAGGGVDQPVAFDQCICGKGDTEDQWEFLYSSEKGWHWRCVFCGKETRVLLYGPQMLLVANSFAALFGGNIGLVEKLYHAAMDARDGLRYFMSGSVSCADVRWLLVEEELAGVLDMIGKIVDPEWGRQ